MSEGQQPVEELTALLQQQRRENQRLIQELERLRIPAYVASLTTNFSIVTDPNKKIVWVNDYFQRYTGYTFEEVKGKEPGSILQGPNTDPDTILKIREALKRREYCQVEIINYTRSGQEYWIDLRISPVFDEDGQLINMFSVAQDISDRKATELKLATANAELKRSNRELEQFASVASHDLGEPLRMVSSFIELLEQRYGDAVGKEGRELIGFASDGARRMKVMMDDLLTLSKVGMVDNDPARTNTNEAVGIALENLSIALQGAGAKVTQAELPDVRVDHSQLIQVFQNLVGNAIKFRGETPLEIKMDAVADGSMVRFSVSDNGKGINPKHANRVFDMFRRVNPKHGEGGSGLGLAICRKIVENRGGKIWVDSELGQGSTFYFTLPG